MDLADEDFVDLPAGTPGRLQSDRAFTQAGLTRRVTIESGDLSMMGDLMAKGLGIALLPPGVVTDRAGIVARSIVDRPERVKCFAWDGFNPTPTARTFLDLVSPSDGFGGSMPE